MEERQWKETQLTAHRWKYQGAHCSSCFCLNWRVAGQSCCVNFCCRMTWLHIHILFHVFHPGLSQDVPCRRSVLLIRSVCNSLHLLSPTSWPIWAPWQPEVCSLCLWVCFCFVDKFICVIFYVSHVSDIIWHLPVSVWLTSLSVIISRCIYVAANGIFHFCFMAVCACAKVYTPHLLMHSSVSSHSGCFLVSGIVSCVAVNVGVHVVFGIAVLSEGTSFLLWKLAIRRKELHTYLTLWIIR